MIVRQHALQIAAVVRRDMEGIRRVSVVRTDGRPFFDDPGDPPTGEDAEAVAAAVAATVSYARRAGTALATGAIDALTIRGREATVVAQPLDDLHVLVVTCGPDVNLVLLGRVLARITATLGPSA
ncbi:roadblock/LC7 domain-containing protein [uncultured Cellulomonas sp.]|uniref:roadblock/LC7 domain-containing protein n=1 Tax=uncultured Cellulomonas sp. TaxID=189682 RepID=UPI0028F114E7|nr:roadblock/LC7 domain-containing protein [uncultured Cellulomonas sp.]